jgi:DNA-binding XRE family transcriptional regulator
MAAKSRGGSVQEWFDEEEARDPGFIAAIDALAGKHVLAAELKKLRQKAGLSQAQLAAKVGTQQPGIARVESGTAMPTLELIFKIASACGHQVLVAFKPRKDRRPPKRARRG